MGSGARACCRSRSRSASLPPPSRGLPDLAGGGRGEAGGGADSVERRRRLPAGRCPDCKDE
uniref:Uncharacterized protein n=1 Tax=Oryza sativa subsp. japonica TaxID=39947 RepID=Q6EU16_ORYSJ|nr:hypothetical protein [Oryza sativa Japonica Group]